jgi:cyclic beta-1,2-glucan synthetase
MRRLDDGSDVVSPYSTFLALLVDPRAAVKNLRAMTKLGWRGRYGFYEGVDYRGDRPEVIRSWMAHHQGMSLLAACNLLFDDRMQHYFHAEPQVLATELLLHERVPSAIVIERESSAPPTLAAEAAA